MRRILETIGAVTLVASMATCSALDSARSRPIAVVQNADGTLTVTEAAPWWGTMLASAISGVAALTGGLYLYRTVPRAARRPDEEAR